MQSEQVCNVSICGENCQTIPHEKVLFYLADNGRIIVNHNAPECIKRCFEKAGEKYDFKR